MHRLLSIARLSPQQTYRPQTPEAIYGGYTRKSYGAETRSGETTRV